MLVLDGQEDHALGRARALADQHQPGQPHPGPGAAGVQPASVPAAQRIQPRPQQRQQVAPQGHAGGQVVLDHRLVLGLVRQGDGGLPAPAAPAPPWRPPRFRRQRRRAAGPAARSPRCEHPSPPDGGWRRCRQRRPPRPAPQASAPLSRRGRSPNSRWVGREYSGRWSSGRHDPGSPARGAGARRGPARARHGRAAASAPRPLRLSPARRAAAFTTR